jgi:hypothetical protein
MQYQRISLLETKEWRLDEQRIKFIPIKNFHSVLFWIIMQMFLNLRNDNVLILRFDVFIFFTLMTKYVLEILFHTYTALIQIITNIARFEILIAVSMKISYGIWHCVARWKLTEVSEEYTASLKIKAKQEFRMDQQQTELFLPGIPSTPKMDAVCSPYISVDSHPTTRYCIP